MPDMGFLFDRVDDLPLLDVNVAEGYDALKLLAEFFGSQ